ncbi:MAG: thiamine pyrophosphokinae [Chloroflexota bacterium]|nr:thiamine pyrophosphokinae [Chloroflexota bacterium]
MAQRAVVVADGEADPAVIRKALVAGLGEQVLAIGADGGARHLESVGRIPDLVVGDADSLSTEDIARFRDAGAAVELHPADKDESDTELAVRAALARGASSVRIAGALAGPRVEHAVANLLLLSAGWLDGLDAAIVHAGSTIRRLGTAEGPGSLALRGEPGDFVSLLPLDDPVQEITTEGLRYPLAGEDLPLGSTRGLSNEFLGTDATVTVARGRLLAIFTRRA